MQSRDTLSMLPARTAQPASTVDRYLRSYCEPDTARLAATVAPGQYKNILVVPCYAEPPDFLTRMSIPGAGSTLTIVVVNAPDNASPVHRTQTIELLRALRTRARPDQLIVDLVTVPLPWRQGVGLARKTGADIALQLIADGIVATQWIYFTDADARLPQDYFQHDLTPAGEDCAAAPGTVLFGFRHHADDTDLQRRANLYEMHLRYYVRGLAAAGSAYAFPTLGSVIAVSAVAYAAVRGVPRRNAAEDFYLLNKLAKVASVTQLDHPVVELAGRYSDRVPFGTGPALASMPAESAAYLSYAPAAFESLSQLLDAQRQFAATGSWQQPPDCGDWLRELGWQRCVDSIEGLTSPVQRARRITEWFDGFRTMRYLRLAASRYPHQPLLASLRTTLADASPAAREGELLDLLRHNGNRFTIS